MKGLFFFFLSFLCSLSFSQTTDLAVSVEAQNLTGTDVSQVHIYEEFQYLINISNSGNGVNNASFTQTINQNAVVLSYVSQNPTGGASDVSGFVLDEDNNILSGTIANLPSSSSVQVRVVLKAPIVLGGIATNVTVFEPTGTTDTNTSNNQSIISIDVVDVDIDFTVNMQQVLPSESTPISTWGSDVTYQFTISNNSIIEFPLDEFRLNASALPSGSGVPNVQVQSLQCIGSAGEAECPTNINVSTAIIGVGANSTIYIFNENIVFPSNSSLTFEVVYRYMEPDCVEFPEPITAENHVQIQPLNHDNVSSNISNLVNTILPEAPECQYTDVAIETTIVSPTGTGISSWNEDVMLETIVTNYGPLEVPIRFFLQNLTAFAVHWNIMSVTCTGTTGNISCSDITYQLSQDVWQTNNFTIPVGATITTQTVLRYVEDCTPVETTYTGQIRSAINMLSEDILDINYLNNFDDDYLQLLPTDACPSPDLQVTKTQINPQQPIGVTAANPMPWEDVTYEIAVENIGDEDTFLALIDRLVPAGNNSTGILQSVNCVSVSGGASCEAISIQNIGLEASGSNPLFWEITQDDAWFMPQGSSVVFHVVVTWLPECDSEPIEVINNVIVEAVNSSVDVNPTNNSDNVSTYFTPCVDLVVQTFPSQTAVPINSSFNWIVDITNSNTSSNAVNVEFLDTVNSVYTITGSPTCLVTNGNASCIASFNINGNTIDGIIPNMDAGSTVRISIPVTAPNFGGAFNNIAEAIPSQINNQETTPETNISISNAQILAPGLSKSFVPNTIYEGEISELIFTINNIDFNSDQNNIAFIDNLPNNIVLAGTPIWLESNGCTATFIGSGGDAFVGVDNLTIPSGVQSCSFSVLVTSDIAGNYLNNNANFNNQNNIDTSQANATLDVIVDTSNVDIMVEKTVSPQIVSIGDEVTFSINVSNIGTTTATNIVVSDILPNGYGLLSYSVSIGQFENNLWIINELQPNQTETLTMIVEVLITGDYVNTAILNNLDQQDRDESNNEDSALVEIDNCLEVAKGLSPNLDGHNDILLITCIEDYPNNTIRIFNRYGVLIYEQDNYQNNWTGVPNRGFPESDKVLPTGVYYYFLSVNGSLVRKGWIYINH